MVRANTRACTCINKLTRTIVLSASLLLSSLPAAPYPVLALNRPNISPSPTTDSRALPQSTSFKGTGSGTLTAMISVGQEAGKTVGLCPLKHTSVTARISGYVAHVQVKQIFENPYKDKIEAIYTFPLSDTGAVDSMLMKVGDRTIRGEIKKREEAQQIYENAKANGHVASLLNEERANIFTQSVANIEPGKTIEVVINYVDLLPYDSGKYTFAFPTVVGPRFMPGTPIGKEGTGRLPDTTDVPDASKISPPVAAEGTRAGHDISIDVSIDAGVPLTNVDSKLHEIRVWRSSKEGANVSLKDKDTIPNKDFVLTWNVATNQLQSGYLTYRDAKVDPSGYFTLMLLPPKRVAAREVAPKEMIFLIDCSGSQRGRPLEKAKETMNYIIDQMNANDTFQIISFNNSSTTLFDHPRQVSDDMKAQARQFIAELQAQGGTWMAPAVEKACQIPADKNRLRIVTFMTDGFVGNDMQIIGMIKKLRGTSRWFPFGTGNSVNRFLIDKIAEEGGGEPDYVLLNSSAQEVGKKFYDKISTPVLTDVKLNIGDLPLKEVFPNQVSDVWADRPLYFKGRYTKPCAGTITLTGFSGGAPYSQPLAVNFPEKNDANVGVASIWARAKVDRLLSEDWAGAQQGAPNRELKDEIVKTALDHHIMTQYTSFVAVEEKTVTKDGQTKTVTVPVELPEGVSREETVNAVQMQTFPSPVFNGSPGVMRRGTYMRAAAPMEAAKSMPMSSSPRFEYQGNLFGAMDQASAAKMVADARYTDKLKVSGSLNHAGSAGGAGGAEQAQLAGLPPPSAMPSGQQQEPAGKIDKAVRRLIDESKAGKRVKAVKAGRIKVKIELSDLSKATLESLQKAGLQLWHTDKAGFVLGSIAPERIDALALLTQVTRISLSGN